MMKIISIISLILFSQVGIGQDSVLAFDEFLSKVDVVTYEFENIPFETLNEINKRKIRKRVLVFCIVFIMYSLNMKNRMYINNYMSFYYKI